MNVEDRLRAAMHAVSDDVQPDEERGLVAVRTRGRAARRRRALLGGATATLALVIGSVAVTRLDGGSGTLISSDEPSVPATASPSSAPAAASTQPTAATSPTVPPTVPPATLDPAAPPPVSVFDEVIWPGPGHVLFEDAVAAARSFVEEFIGFEDPPMGEFRASGADIGTVDVHNRTELGAVSNDVKSTITVQRLDGHWYVTGAVDDEVRIDSPAPHAEVVSPVRVEGRGQGYESTIIVEVRDAFSAPGDSLGQKVTMGGSYEAALPFSALVPLSTPSGSTGVIIASTDSGLPGGGSFAANPVRFAPNTGSGEPGAVTTLRVFFPRVADGELVEVERTVSKTTGVLRASLVALLDGPTDDERGAGLMTWFPQDSGGALDDVNLSDGLATVQLSTRLAEAEPPPTADELIAQLNATVFQFDNVNAVRYELDGSCEAFDAWLHQGCEFTRQTPTAAPASWTPCPDEGFNLEELQASVDEGHQPWMTSAPDVAAACTFGQPNAAVEPAGENTFLVTEPSTGNTVLVTVAQPLRTGPTGIWVVTSIDFQGRSIQPAPSGDAPCTAEAILPVVRQQLSEIDIIGVDITECQHGYARVIARIDTSRCGNDGTCGEDAEQIFLVAENGTWDYLTSGTGITCEHGAVFPPEPLAVLAACEALGLR